jgi:ribose transport system permease protein
MAYVLSGESSIAVPFSFGILTTGTFLGIQFNVWILALSYLLAWWYLYYTKGGRTLHALGSNAEAASVAGLRVDRYRISAFVVSGFASAVAAVFLSARVLSIDPVAGTGLELDAIAAVMIGGASLFGGRAPVIGTLIGAVIMVMSNFSLTPGIINATHTSTGWTQLADSL